MRSLTLFTFLICLSLPDHSRAQGSRPQGASDSGGGVTTRVEKLEEQLVDLQAVVAAVETLAKSGAGSNSGGYSAPAAGPGGDQVRQLSEQIAELTQRIERLEARLTVGGSGAQTGPAPRPTTPVTPQASGFDDKQPLPPVSGPPPRTAQSQFGTSVETKPTPPQRAPIASDTATGPRPATTATSPGAQALYDQASSAFSRKEFSAAETYYNQFLDQYPNDGKAGLAQFWLGEAAFATGEYKAAADRFLKAFNNYQSSEKAPEALLKLAISLRRIGETNAACESFAELQKRFPQAPKAVTQRAEAEKRRANCS